MKLIRTISSTLLLMSLAVPAMASADWVEEFLRRYDPAKGPATATVASNPASAAELGQLIRTGEVGTMTMPANTNQVAQEAALSRSLMWSSPIIITP